MRIHFLRTHPQSAGWPKRQQVNDEGFGFSAPGHGQDCPSSPPATTGKADQSVRVGR